MGDITVELHSGMTPEEWDRAMAKLDEFGFAQKAAEKKGKWNKSYVCDQCGFKSIEASNYCPNCGARMEESDDNE